MIIDQVLALFIPFVYLYFHSFIHSFDIIVLSRSVVSNSFATLWIASSPPGSSVHGDSRGKTTGVGCPSLLEDIFPTQGAKPGLPHCRWILNCHNHQGSPRILEWVAYPFSRRSSLPRNQTMVSCVAGGFFTSGHTREAH